jgi:hypothetical protein
MIQLCDPGASPTQEQDVVECGDDYSTVRICMTLSDEANVFGGRDYDFDLSIDKDGVGIRDVQVCDRFGACTDIPEIALTRYDEDGDEITVIVPPADLEDMVDTKSVSFTTALQPLTNYVTFTVAYDSCVATPGDLEAELMVNLDPCGDSFGTLNELTVARLTTCGDDGMGPISEFQWVFSYSPIPDNNPWWAGVAVTNLTNSSIDVDLLAYEADGDLFSASVSIPPKNCIPVLVRDINWDAEDNDQTFGDEEFWMVASSASQFTGLFFFGDSAAGVGMGYIPFLLNDSSLSVAPPD